MDRAWMRRSFKHSQVALWAAENRSALVHAALVLVQAWIAAGKPLGEKRLGSFESWAAVMSGMLEVVGIRGFLENLNKMYADADVESEPWRGFTAVWWETHGNRPMRVSELNSMCEKHKLMAAIRGDGGERSQEIRLGNALLAKRDRVYGRLRIVDLPGDKHRGRWYALELNDRVESALDLPTDDFDSNGVVELQETGSCIG
jgi:putative DNA primase/helicase